MWSTRKISEFASSDDEWLAIDENGTLVKRFRLNINIFEDNTTQRRSQTIASQADVRSVLTELPTKYIEKLEAKEYLKFVKGEWLQPIDVKRLDHLITYIKARLHGLNTEARGACRTP